MKELKTKVQHHVDSVLQSFEEIESKQRRRDGWIRLQNIVISNRDWRDDAIYHEMIKQLGKDSLRKLITQVAPDFIKALELEVAAQSCDLNMKIKDRT